MVYCHGLFVSWCRTYHEAFRPVDCYGARGKECDAIRYQCGGVSAAFFLFICISFLCLCKERNKESTADFDAGAVASCLFLGRNRRLRTELLRTLPVEHRARRYECFMLHTLCRVWQPD